MWKITFDELADYLMHGREIEFRYEGKAYSITNRRHEWIFCCDTDETTILLCEFPGYDVIGDKVRQQHINGISLEKIFNEGLGGLDIIDVL